MNNDMEMECEEQLNENKKRILKDVKEQTGTKKKVCFSDDVQIFTFPTTANSSADSDQEASQADIEEQKSKLNEQLESFIVETHLIRTVKITRGPTLSDSICNSYLQYVSQVVVGNANHPGVIVGCKKDRRSTLAQINTNFSQMSVRQDSSSTWSNAIQHSQVISSRQSENLSNTNYNQTFFRQRTPSQGIPNCNLNFMSTPVQRQNFSNCYTGTQFESNNGTMGQNSQNLSFKNQSNSRPSFVQTDATSSSRNHSFGASQGNNPSNGLFDPVKRENSKISTPRNNEAGSRQYQLGFFGTPFSSENVNSNLLGASNGREACINQRPDSRSNFSRSSSPILSGMINSTPVRAMSTFTGASQSQRSNSNVTNSWTAFGNNAKLLIRSKPASSTNFQAKQNQSQLHNFNPSTPSTSGSHNNYSLMQRTPHNQSSRSSSFFTPANEERQAVQDPTKRASSFFSQSKEKEAKRPRLSLLQDVPVEKQKTDFKFAMPKTPLLRTQGFAGKPKIKQEVQVSGRHLTKMLLDPKYVLVVF